MALAALILPTAVSNIWQSARGGFGNAIEAAKAHRLYIAIVLVMILLSAQVVLLLPDRVAFLLIGLPITAFAATQLLGWRPRIGAPNAAAGGNTGIGLLAGTMGGISGHMGAADGALTHRARTPKKGLRCRCRAWSTAWARLSFLGRSHQLRRVHRRAGPTFPSIICVPAGSGCSRGSGCRTARPGALPHELPLAVLVIAGANLHPPGHLRLEKGEPKAPTRSRAFLPDRGGANVVVDLVLRIARNSSAEQSPRSFFRLRRRRPPGLPRSSSRSEQGYRAPRSLFTWVGAPRRPKFGSVR